MLILSFVIFFFTISQVVATPNDNKQVQTKFNATGRSFKDKYRVDRNSIVLGAKDKNSVGVTLGDPVVTNFKPQLKMQRWNGKAVFTIKPKIDPAETGAEHLTFEGDTVNFDTSDETYRFYDLPVSELNPDGAYEFEVILKNKPITNVIQMPIETTGLDFFYQPSLKNDIRKFNAVSCTDTECFDKRGRVTNSRPERVVGSYAVYYKNNISGDYSAMGGMNYKTGKAFHIYRPLLIDAAKNTIWGDLHIDQKRGVLSITVPQSFIDTAVYPIIVDPTIGYNSAGGSWDSTNNYLIAGRFSAPNSGAANSGTAYAYLDSVSGTLTAMMAAYANNAGTVQGQSKLSGNATLSGVTTANWYSGTITWTGITIGTDYFISLNHQLNGRIAYDTATAGYNDMEYQYRVHSNDMPDPWPNPYEGTQAWQLSMYISYTASGFYCEVTASCADTTIMKISGTDNAHAGTAGASSYSQLVCCSGVTGLGNDCGAATKAVVLNLTGTDNAHVKQTDVTQSGYGTDVCISIASGTVSVGYRDTDCTGYNTTVVKISDTNNAHVSNDASSYVRRVCASASASGGGSLTTSASSSLSFDSSLAALYTRQTSTASRIGAIQVDDQRGSSAGWTLSMAAADWTTGDGTPQLDYNGNGSDDNTGKLCPKPNNGTLYAQSGSMTGVSKGSNVCFGSTVSSINLATATAGNGAGTYWLVDMPTEQLFPSFPAVATYTSTIVFTIS